MIGTWAEFECKSCNLEQKHHVGITPIVRVNGGGKTYIPLKCRECNKWHYVALKKTGEDNDVISEDEAVTIEGAGTICF